MTVLVSDPAFAWRKSCFEELGFSEHESNALADATVYSIVKTKTGDKGHESPLHHVNVKRLMEAGASHADILEIYL